MIPAVALVIFMASCANVKSDAEKTCARLTQMVDAQKGNDMAKIESLQKEYDAEMEKMKTKYAAGSDEAKEFESLIKPCADEAKKAELKANAEAICNMMNKLVAAEAINDTITIEALQKEFKPKMEAFEKKYKTGSAEEKELEELVKPCIEEAMKATFGG